MQENLLMSIKTKYANKIFDGTKIYEFRRKSIGEKNLNLKNREQEMYKKLVLDSPMTKNVKKTN